MFDPTLFDASRLSAPAAAFVDAVTELAGRPSEAGPVDWCGLTVTRPGDEETLNEVKALAFAFKAAAANARAALRPPCSWRSADPAGCA